MTYPINKTDGTLLTNLADNTVDNTSSSLFLVGRRTTAYGEPQNENFVHLLENFANTTAPLNSLLGQTWYDKTSNVLKVCVNPVGPVYKQLQYVNVTMPVVPTIGELWYDVVNEVLKIWDGTSWVTIGPINPDLFENFTGSASTSNATPTANINIPVAADSVYSVKAFLTARDTITKADVAFFELTYSAYRILAGSAIESDQPNKQIHARTTGAAATQPWDIDASVSSSNIVISVTGQNSTNIINWKLVANIYKL